MVSITYFEDTVKNLYKAYYQSNNGEADDFIRWKNLTTDALKALKAYIQRSDLTKAIQRRCQTCVFHLNYIEVQLNNFIKVGGNVQPSQNTEDQIEGDGVVWRKIHSAFKNRIYTAAIVNQTHLDISTFLDATNELLKTQIKKSLIIHKALKVNTEMAAQFSVNKNNEEEIQIKYFNTENVSIYKTTNLELWFQDSIKSVILKNIEEFQERDSGWSLKTIVGLTVNINKHNPLKPSSYIPLPPFIRYKKACINVQNNDNECFKWAVLSCLHPAKDNGHRIEHYEPYRNELNFNGISFPVQTKSISKFEKLNDISVNVYILTKHGRQYEVSPCHVTKSKKDKHVNLLLIQNHYEDEYEKSENEIDFVDENFVLKFHYVWIKNLSALVRSQITNDTKKLYLCDRCLHYFKDEEKLKNHEIDCSNINKCKINLPVKNPILKFKNYKRKETVPYIIYADFECLLKPIHIKKGPPDSKRYVFQEHEAFSVGFYIKCSFDESKSIFKSYRKMNNEDDSPADWLVKQLKSLLVDLQTVYDNAVEMNLHWLEELTFKQAKKCHICNVMFKLNEKAVRDHCHLTGKFRGAAHNHCNLNYKNASFIPVVFHNFTGYDSHFIVKEIATHPNFEGKIHVLAENKERYISFTKEVVNSRIRFRFIDSFRFMPSSLDKLASYCTEINIVKHEFEKDIYTTAQIELLKRKGVFPYEYISCLDKLNQNKLPSIEEFHSQLTDSNISTEDYEHAVNVWNTFDIKNLGQYSDLYLKTDVLLLADVFENFRKTCKEAYELDPAHYYTTPGLTWEAMLKYTAVELELLTDVDMVLFIQKGIRGGISQCCNRYAKANNKYMGEDFNDKDPIKTLMYFDVNNLYGWAMTQALPYQGFEWVSNIDEPDFYNVPDDNEIGFILEVDIEYDKALHDDHKDLPLCPEHGAPPGSKQEKLLTTLYDKERYIIHYRALKQALQYGLKLKKIHRALKFKQKPWLKPYVDLNTKKRKEAKNEFDKLFYKLMVNATYGKTMEDERKRKDVKLVNQWEGRYGAEAYIAKPNFHSSSIFCENLAAIQLSWTSISINKPIYIGLCVLDLSKTLVYEFHYGYMKQRFGNKCKLLYTDTDSLVYEIQDDDIYEVMKEDIDKFDTSDYPVDNRFNMPLANKKVLGVMKDECNGCIMLEFIGLRSKMYSITIQNKKPVRKAKGVKTQIVRNNITHENYRSCLEKMEIIKREQCSIRSIFHKVQTEREEKIALSPFDDKRCMYKNDPNTLPWGHYKTLEISKLKERIALLRKNRREVAIETAEIRDVSKEINHLVKEKSCRGQPEQNEIPSLLKRCRSSQASSEEEGPARKRIRKKMAAAATQVRGVGQWIDTKSSSSGANEREGDCVGGLSSKSGDARNKTQSSLQTSTVVQQHLETAVSSSSSSSSLE